VASSSHGPRLEVDSPGYRWLVVAEHADGTIHTADVSRTRDGHLSFVWGRHSKRGTPDATPLPETIVELKGRARAPR
jgi:hypothetical protein